MAQVNVHILLWQRFISMPKLCSTGKKPEQNVEDIESASKKSGPHFFYSLKGNFYFYGHPNSRPKE